MQQGSKSQQMAIARPSASVILISARHEVLLLQRVQHTTTFAAAHVFPGGNADEEQDGILPTINDPKRHEDTECYRNAAIRETFEESGILLAKDTTTNECIQMDESEREKGRHSTHTNKIKFKDWLASNGARPAIDDLIPFTRWLTPRYMPKRYTTQMYIYLLPLEQKNDEMSESNRSKYLPSHDGGKEHTEARFLPASEWLSLARSGKIILFPPQFLLLYLLDPFLANEGLTINQLQQKREELTQFVNSGDPPWYDKCISPMRMKGSRKDERQVLSLDGSGPEIESGRRRGESDLILLADFRKEGPRNLEVRRREHAFDQDIEGKL